MYLIHVSRHSSLKQLTSFKPLWYSRIKNKLTAKIDEIKNEELTKKYYEDVEKILSEEKSHKISQFNKNYNFMDIKTIFSEVLYTDQIFNLNIYL